MGDTATSSAMVPWISAMIGGLCTAFIAPFITSFLSERSRKLDLYKTVYPEKFKAAREVMEKMSGLYVAVITKRATVDAETLIAQVTDFGLTAAFYDWLLGNVYKGAATTF